MEVASVLAVAEALEVASALLGAAVPPSNTPPPHPPAGRATGTEVLRLALGSTLSQAPCPAAWPSLQVPSFLCVLLLLVFEVELKLLSALISPLCPYLLHLSFHRSPSESHCVSYSRTGQLPLAVHWSRNIPPSKCGFLLCSGHGNTSDYFYNVQSLYPCYVSSALCSLVIAK